MNEPSAQFDDQQLIRETLDGKPEAFGSLIQKYQNRLYNGMVHVLRNEVEAEDVVQDAFVLAYTKLNTFKGKSAFFTWLYRIAYNAAITRIRRRRPTVSLEGKDEGQRLDFPDAGSAPSDRMQRDEQSVQLNQALEKLSEEHRSILVLREMEDMDYEAISEILDLPIGTVRSRLHRARGQLKEQLEIIMGSDADGA